MTLQQAQDLGIAPWTDQVYDLDEVVAFYDRYPVSPGHMLFVPKIDCGLSVAKALDMAYRFGRISVANGDCDSFNVGINYGIGAGQTVMYPHVHMIPRRLGDCEDPTGGVRNVIPGMGNYKNK